MKKLYILFMLLFQIGFAQAPAIQWQKTFGGSDSDSAYSIIQTSDEGYVFISSISSGDGDVEGFHGGRDIWVVKTSASGTIEWQKALGGSSGEQAVTIEQTSDGGYILVGTTNSMDGDITELHTGYCTWVVKLSATGNIDWQKIYPTSEYNEAQSIRQTIDGGYIFVGSIYFDADNGNSDVWIVKLSPLGVIEWQKMLGGSLNEYGTNIRQTDDGGYVVLAYGSSSDRDFTQNYGEDDYWIVKLSNLGYLQWQKSFGGSSDDTAIGLCLTADGGYVVAGRTQSSDFDVTGLHGFADAWVVKLDSAGTLEWQKTLGGSSTDIFFDIKQTLDGGYIAVGTSSSINGDVSGTHWGLGDCWLVRLSETGTIIWQKCLGGSLSDAGNRISITDDGGYIIGGTTQSTDGDVTNSHGNTDCWIIKLAPEVLANPDFIRKELKLYPSPTTSIITIENFEGLSLDAVIISDLAGKKILNLTAPGNQIDISGLAAGTYLLEGISAEQKFTSKFIKE